DKDFKNVTRDDVLRVVGEIECTDYSPHTKQGKKVALKVFFKWFKKTDGYPLEVAGIKTTIPRSKKTLPSDLLTEEDVQLLIETSEYPRNKALVSILWESGARTSEILTLHVGDVTNDDYGMLITMIGKTGSRKVRLVSSVPYINMWLAQHPDKNDPNAPLWRDMNKRGEERALHYYALRMMLIRLAKDAKLTRPVNPHHFRHSRATYLASRLKESVLDQYMGWTIGSKMPAVYVHLSGRDTDDAILAMYGKKQAPEDKISKLTPRDCSRCDTKNAVDARFCQKCGMPLDLETALEAEEYAKKEHMAQEEVMKAMMKGEKMDLEALAEMVAKKIRERS
ncbi:MAG: tyrosine-type recombinase/integrase, partial [Desulfobacteraceae bacterium]|nr:tyrosine-type recombinase/integrase [Desulfobacteraceae bacterium]